MNIFGYYYSMFMKYIDDDFNYQDIADYYLNTKSSKNFSSRMSSKRPIRLDKIIVDKKIIFASKYG